MQQQTEQRLSTGGPRYLCHVKLICTVLFYNFLSYFGSTSCLCPSLPVLLLPICVIASTCALNLFVDLTHVSLLSCVPSGNQHFVYALFRCWVTALAFCLFFFLECCLVFVCFSEFSLFRVVFWLLICFLRLALAQWILIAEMSGEISPSINSHFHFIKLYFELFVEMAQVQSSVLTPWMHSKMGSKEDQREYRKKTET